MIFRLRTFYMPNAVLIASALVHGNEQTTNEVHFLTVPIALSYYAPDIAYDIVTPVLRSVDPVSLSGIAYPS